MHRFFCLIIQKPGWILETGWLSKGVTYDKHCLSISQQCDIGHDLSDRVVVVHLTMIL